MVVMSVGWVARVAALLVLGFLDLRAGLAGLGAIGVVDAIFLWKPLAKFRESSRLVYVLPFEIYFTFYVLFLPFVAALSKRVVWKERTL
jgi:hypothetical protein